MPLDRLDAGLGDGVAVGDATAWQTSLLMTPLYCALYVPIMWAVEHKVEAAPALVPAPLVV